MRGRGRRLARRKVAARVVWRRQGDDPGGLDGEHLSEEGREQARAHEGAADARQGTLSASCSSLEQAGAIAHSEVSLRERLPLKLTHLVLRSNLELCLRPAILSASRHLRHSSQRQGHRCSATRAIR
eukprot:5762416-Pleurochrysis_carterae.AAC.1